MWLVIRWILLPLTVEFIVWLTRIFACGAGGSSLGPGGPAPLAKILRLIVEFANQTMNSTANGSRIHRITNHTCWTPFKGLSFFYFFSWLDPPSGALDKLSFFACWTPPCWNRGSQIYLFWGSQAESPTKGPYTKLNRSPTKLNKRGRYFGFFLNFKALPWAPRVKYTKQVLPHT